MTIQESVRAVIQRDPKTWLLLLITTLVCLLLAAALFINAVTTRAAFEPLSVSRPPVIENRDLVGAGASQLLLSGEWCLKFDQVVTGFRSVYLLPEYGAPVQLAVQPRLWKTGCELVRTPYTIPPSLPKGVYRLAGTDVAQGPDGRLQQTGWSTEPFEVPARAESQ